jgi:hypothetical protein
MNSIFIKNSNGDIVNTAKITAVTFNLENDIYEMTVFTNEAKMGVSFKYENELHIQRAAKNLKKMLMATNLRMIKFGNWWLMAKDVDSVMSCGDGIRIRMTSGQRFDIILRTPEEIEKCKKEIAWSLNEQYALADLDSDEN